MATSFCPFHMGVPPGLQWEANVLFTIFRAVYLIWTRPLLYLFLLHLFQSPSNICNIIIFKTAIKMPCLTVGLFRKSDWCMWYLMICKYFFGLEQKHFYCCVNSHSSTCESVIIFTIVASLNWNTSNSLVLLVVDSAVKIVLQFAAAAIYRRAFSFLFT